MIIYYFSDSSAFQLQLLQDIAGRLVPFLPQLEVNPLQHLDADFHS